MKKLLLCSFILLTSLACHFLYVGFMIQRAILVRKSDIAAANSMALLRKPNVSPVFV